MQLSRFSDADSGYSLIISSQNRSESKAARWDGKGQVDEDAYLKMREEYLRMKRKGQDDHQKMRELAAQLARTEEAAKRLMVRQDKSARGGAAARLLAAEKELSRVSANATEAHNKLRELVRSNKELRSKNAEQRKRLEEALRDQRRLVVEVGRAQRQGSRLRTVQSSRMQPAGTGQAQANGSPLQPCSPSQPRSPTSLAWPATAHDSLEAPNERVLSADRQSSALALRKLKALSLSRCSSPRVPAIGAPSPLQAPLQSLQLQIHEALHRAEGLQQQLNALHTQTALRTTAATDPHSDAPQGLTHGCERFTVAAAAHAAPLAVQDGTGGASISGGNSGAGTQGASGGDAERDCKIATTRNGGAGLHGVQQEWLAPSEAGSDGALVHHSDHPSPTRCFWRRINPGVEGWPDPDRWLTVALHSVRLHPKQAQHHARERLFLMYSFLPEHCPAEQQCTHSLPATDTLLTFQHVQAYELCGEGRQHLEDDHGLSALKGGTMAGDVHIIPICLVIQSQDLAREQHQQLGTCRLNLRDGDCLHACTALHDEHGAAIATLMLSVIGSATVCP